MLLLVVLGVAFAIEPASWRALPAGFASIGTLPEGLSVALVFGAIAFAGAGGAQNLCQSNWIRDKGFGMGQYVPRLVSPVTGAPEARDTAATSYIFETTPANMARWRRWWRFANVEQACSFVLVTVLTIGLTSLLAHSTLFGQPDLPNDVSFLRIEAQQLGRTVGPWFGVLFLAVGAFSLFGTGHGHHRLHQPPGRRHPEDDLFPRRVGKPHVFLARLGTWSRSAARSCWRACHSRLTLLVISASTAGTMMFFYSFLLIALNRKLLPAAIRIGPLRTAALVWSTLLFGSLAVLNVYTQVQNLLR